MPYTKGRCRSTVCQKGDWWVWRPTVLDCTVMQVDAGDADDYSSYSELESASSTLDHDEFQFVELIPPTSVDRRPPAPPPPRPRSPATDWRRQQGTCSSSTRSTAVMRSATAAHARRRTTSTTSGAGSVAHRLHVVNNEAYRHRSPDVIPSLCKTPSSATVAFIYQHKLPRKKLNIRIAQNWKESLCTQVLAGKQASLWLLNMAKYCDQRVCMYMSLFVRCHIS